jgi:hypothetical protein
MVAVVLLAVISVAAAVETVGNRINYLIEKGNHWFPFSFYTMEVVKEVQLVNFHPLNPFNPNPILFCNFAEQTCT